jgi:hypothetical protein
MDINKIIADIQTATEQISQTLEKIKTSQQRFDALESSHKEINTSFLAISKQLKNQQEILIAAQEKANNNQLQSIDNKVVILNTNYENSTKKLAETLAFFKQFIDSAEMVSGANKALIQQFNGIDFPKKFEEIANTWRTNIAAQNKEIANLNAQIKAGQSAQIEQIDKLKVKDLLGSMGAQVEKLAQVVSSVEKKIQEKTQETQIKTQETQAKTQEMQIKTQETQAKIQEMQANLARLEATQKEHFEKIQTQILATNVEIQTQAQRQNVLIYIVLALIVVLFVVIIFKS